MSAHASATVQTPDGTTVHLLGVSHTSAFYGQLTHDAITDIKPDAVVLEIDEARLRDQAERAALWLEHGKRTSIVQAAVQPFLSSSGTSSAPFPAYLAALRRHAYALANEGSALVEGAVYGSEVVMACQAASATGAAIVLADRAKTLSRARLQAAAAKAQTDTLAAIPDDDWSLLRASVQTAMRNLTSNASAAMAPLFVGDGRLFGRSLHPIFELVDSASDASTLQAAGCTNAADVVASLRRLMDAGSRKDAEIDPADLKTVQECIAKVEQHKHRCRQAVFAAAQRPAALPQSCATAAMRSTAQEGMNAPAALLELAQRMDEPQPEPAIVVSGTLDVAQMLSSAASIAWHAAGLSTDAASCSGAFAQWCSRGIGHMQSFSLAEHVAGVRDAVAATHAEVAGACMSPYYRTTVYERDSILASRIWTVASDPGTKSVVAVVGANHVPGILRNWHRAGTDEARAEVQSFLSLPVTCENGASTRWKADVVRGVAHVVEAAVVGAAMYLPYRAMAKVAPRAARWLPVGMAGGAALLAGAAVRQHERVAHLVHNVAVAQDRMDAAQRQSV